MVHLHYRLAKEASYEYKLTRAVYKKLCNELRESGTNSVVIRAVLAKTAHMGLK